MQKTFERYVPHTAEQMLALVADVESYPQFIPHCESMKVRRSTEAPQTRFDATMAVKFGPIRQAYTSRIAVDTADKTLRATAKDGPFSHLDSQWSFREDGAGSTIRFDIDFKIANPLIRSVAEPAFAAKQEEIIDAFVAEASRRYAG